jgi:glycosyltransferase involved in cell wall biosynthesis
MNTLRVLVISMWPSDAAPERGAFVERQVAALRDLGVEVEVAPLTDVRTGPLWTPLKYLRLVLDAHRRVRRFRPDIVHGHYLVPTGSVTRRVARKAGLPYVVTAHGTDVRNVSSRPRVRAATEAVVDDAAHIIAVSQQLAEELRTNFPSAPTAAVSHMGVDIDRFQVTDRDAARTATGWTAPGLRIVAVGTLNENKNHATLIEAIATLEDVSLTIVGGGPARSTLEAKAEDLGCADRVHFTGRVEHSNLAQWLNAADVLCLPSYAEGFGLVALEALACGTPVVASVTAPVSTVVVEGEVGVAVDPNSAAAIAAGIRSVVEQDVPRSRARAVAEGHSAVVRAREVAEILRDSVH